MAVLYQTYRPQVFADVIGQDAIVKVLRNAVKNGQLAHAYLFTGSRGIGKTTIARLVAKAANCPHIKNGEPDGTCDTCVAIAAGSFLDVVEIDAASHTGVDNVRELIEHMQFKPGQGKMKVFIIDEVHMLSKAAFNALLKTLEEPPAHAMFILATTDIEKVPETIISRTQRFDFRRISPEVMLAALAAITKKEKITLPDGALEAIVQNSDGGMRDALSLLGTAASLGSDATIDDIRTLLGITPLAVVQELVGLIAVHDATRTPAFIDEQVSLGVDFTVLNRNILEYLREVLVAKVSGRSDADGNITEHAASFTMPQLLFVIRLFLRSYKEIGQSPSGELPVLLAAIEGCLHGTTNAAAVAPVANKAAAGASAPKPLVTSLIETTPPPTVTPVIASTPEPSAEAEVTTEELDTTITLQEVQQHWPDIIARIKTLNSPLATLLKNSPVQEVTDGKVVIGVKYLFHKENIDSKKNTAIIQETLFAVCGKHIGVKSVINKQLADTEVVNTVDALSDAIKIFGGELVE